MGLASLQQCLGDGSFHIQVTRQLYNVSAVVLHEPSQAALYYRPAARRHRGACPQDTTSELPLVIISPNPVPQHTGN